MPRTTPRPVHRVRPAQGLTEFALVLPLFLLVVAATIDLARAYVSYTVAANVAREVARHAAATVGVPNWQANAVDYGVSLAVGIDPSALSLTVTGPASATDPLPYVTVTGVYAFRPLIPFAAAILGDPVPMQVSTAALVG